MSAVVLLKNLGNKFLLAHDIREIDLIVFNEVLEMMSQVDRIISSPGGSLLMVGRSGVGRRSAVSVVANMHQMQVFTPKVSAGYGLKQFRNDLKQVWHFGLKGG